MHHLFGQVTIVFFCLFSGTHATTTGEETEDFRFSMSSGEASGLSPLDFQCPFIQAGLFDFLPLAETILNLRTPEKSTLPMRPLLVQLTSEDVLNRDEQQIPLIMIMESIYYSLNNLLEAVRCDNFSNQNLSNPLNEEQPTENSLFSQQVSMHRTSIEREMRIQCSKDVGYWSAPLNNNCWDRDLWSNGQDLNWIHWIDTPLFKEMQLAIDYVKKNESIAVLKRIDTGCMRHYWEEDREGWDDRDGGEDKKNRDVPQHQPQQLQPTLNNSMITNGNVMFLTSNPTVHIPAIGMGLGCGEFSESRFEIEGREDSELIDYIGHAISLGVRHFDTAEVYDNEQLLGQAILNSGIDRDRFTIASKLDDKRLAEFCSFANHSTSNHKYLVVLDYVRERVQHQLKRLGTDYIDFYTLHHVEEPNIDYRNEVQQHAIDAMLQLAKQGLIKTVLHNGPALNNSRVFAQQQKYSVLHQNERTCKDCKLVDVFVGNSQLTDLPEHISFMFTTHARYISTTVGKTPSQLVLRWSLQQGVAVIPCSVNPVHIAENVPSELLSFSLSAKIMKRMNSFKHLLAPLVVSTHDHHHNDDDNGDDNDDNDDSSTPDHTLMLDAVDERDMGEM